MKEDNPARKRQKALRIILITLITILLVLEFASLRRLVTLGLFIAANFFLAFGKRIMPKMGFRKYLFGIELVMFSTVLTSMTFGPFVGAVMGGLLMVVNYLGERRFSPYFIVTTILYSLVGVAAYYFRAYDLLLVGMAITIVYNIIATIIVSFLDATRSTMLVFNIINICFNALIFSWLGPLFRSLLA